MYIPYMLNYAESINTIIRDSHIWQITKVFIALSAHKNYECIVTS